MRATTVEGVRAVTLAASDEAVEATFVPALAMVCCSLRVHGHELLDPRSGLEAYAERASTMGIPLLHPWANRLGGFGYSAAGRTVTLPHDSPLLKLEEHGLPIHGVRPVAMPFQLELEPRPSSELEPRPQGPSDAATAAGSKLRARLRFDREELLELFPFPHELVYEARLGDAALELSLTLTATGATPVPVSFGFHPYLRIPGPRDRAIAEIPARARLVLDSKELPTGAQEPFQAGPHRLGERDWDDGFAELEPRPFSISAPADESDAGPRRLEVTFLEGLDFGQVYSPAGTRFVCFEPMTAPANALASGSPDLRLVAPGESYHAAFRIDWRQMGEP